MGKGNPLGEFSEQLAAVVAAAGNAVVQVRSRHGRPATGTAIGGDRFIVAAHAVDGDRDVTVRKHGASQAAEVLGADPSSDLAVLRAAGLAEGTLDAGSPARVGQLAIGLGRTWSGALAASAGIVSVIGGPLRTGRGTSIDEVLRADVHVHPLGAGGPLVNTDGQAIGIATNGAIRGLPLFIPAAIAWRIAEALTSHGRIKRGYLGISAQPIRIPAAQRAGRDQETGLLVVGTGSGSPAEHAGVMVGDLVVGFDGQRVQDHDDLLALLTADRVGKAVPLDVIRGADARSIAVTVGEH